MCANDGRKINHAGFNTAPGQFQHEIRERTRLPLKVTRPGTWTSKTIEVPYEEVETYEEYLRALDPLACAALDIKLDPDRNMIAGVDLATYPSVDSAVDEVFG